MLSLVLVWAAHVGSTEGELADFLPYLTWGAPWLVGRTWLAARRSRLALDGIVRPSGSLTKRRRTREAAQQEARPDRPCAARRGGPRGVPDRSFRPAPSGWRGPTTRAGRPSRRSRRPAVARLGGSCARRSGCSAALGSEDLATRSRTWRRCPPWSSRSGRPGRPSSCGVTGDNVVPAGTALSAVPGVAAGGRTNVLGSARGRRRHTDVIVHAGPDDVAVEAAAASYRPRTDRASPGSWTRRHGHA